MRVVDDIYTTPALFRCLMVLEGFSSQAYDNTDFMGIPFCY